MFFPVRRPNSKCRYDFHLVGGDLVVFLVAAIDCCLSSSMKTMALSGETSTTEDYWLPLVEQQYCERHHRRSSKRSSNSSLHSITGFVQRQVNEDDDDDDDNEEDVLERQHRYSTLLLSSSSTFNKDTNGNSCSILPADGVDRSCCCSYSSSSPSPSSSVSSSSDIVVGRRRQRTTDDDRKTAAVCESNDDDRFDLQQIEKRTTFKRKRKPIRGGDINAERSRYARSKSSFFRRNTTTVFECGANNLDRGDLIDSGGEFARDNEISRLLRSDTDLCLQSKRKTRSILDLNNKATVRNGKKESLLVSQPNNNTTSTAVISGGKSPVSENSDPFSPFNNNNNNFNLNNYKSKDFQSSLPLVHKPSSSVFDHHQRNNYKSKDYTTTTSHQSTRRASSLTTDQSPTDGCVTTSTSLLNNYDATSECRHHTWRRFKSVPEDTGDEEISTVADTDEKLVLLGCKNEPNDIGSVSSSSPSSMTCLCNATAVNGGSSSINAGGRLSRWSRSKMDLFVPSLRSLVSLTAGKLAKPSSGLLCDNATTNGSFDKNNFHHHHHMSRNSACSSFLRRNISLNSVINDNRPLSVATDSDATSCNLRKCNTMVTLINNGSGVKNAAGTTETRLHHQLLQPLRPVNRLRIGQSSGSSLSINNNNNNNKDNDVRYYHPSSSALCSRCSSLLSMASSSRYSLNSTMSFVHVKAPTVLCKVCLNEVPLKDSWTLQHCECTYCVGCVRSYVEFEINEGAYSISCPDAQCEKQGIILLEEIESLVSFENIERHKRYRLNKEVEMDKSRTWCPRAGCETVCTLCNVVDRTTPQDVRCPTCQNEFCSVCKSAWHAGSPCKAEDSIAGMTFDSELIKCCPMCSVPIEKDEGCAQMLCKRCKHVFCWYCLASLDDDFLLRHYDKGPCKNKLGHSRASVIWHRTQVISIFAGFGILLLIASPLLLLAAPCIVCCKCRVCTSDSKLDNEDDIPDVEYRPKTSITASTTTNTAVAAAADAPPNTDQSDKNNSTKE